MEDFSRNCAFLFLGNALRRISLRAHKSPEVFRIICVTELSTNNHETLDKAMKSSSLKPDRNDDARPTEAPTEGPFKQDDLKRLGFVESTATAVTERATSLAYSIAKATPEPVANVAASAYEAIAPTVKPYAQKAYDVIQPTAKDVLVTVDAKVKTPRRNLQCQSDVRPLSVDSAMTYGEEYYSATPKTYDGAKKLVSIKAMEFQEQMSVHLEYVENVLNSITDQLNLPSSREAATL
eukprot:scaffold278455_cov37-Prasinocladus_malaysianus.AAC.1